MYEPLQKYLRNQGYRVNSEVKNCDITAMKEGELILIELKMRFSLSLVYQLLDRKTMVDSVYAALPVWGAGSSLPRSKHVKSLLKRIEVGLIFVRFLKRSTRVEVVFHPQPFEARRRKKKRESIIREIEGRYGEFNKGGSAVGDKRISTYKQEAIRIAWLLSRMGSASPKQLRNEGCGDKTQPILSQNLYGWFEKERRGVYMLSKEGYKALYQYKECVSLLESHRVKE